MKKSDLLAEIALGEDSTRQFKKISATAIPFLVSFVAKGLLPYHRLGSGIKRALEAWVDIEFTDDREGCQFTVKVHRKKAESSGKGSGKSSGKTENQIIVLLSDRPNLTIPELSETLNITTRAVEKQISKLRVDGRLRRIGPAKGGHWEIVEKDEK